MRFALGVSMIIALLVQPAMAAPEETPRMFSPSMLRTEQGGRQQAPLPVSPAERPIQTLDVDGARHFLMAGPSGCRIIAATNLDWQPPLGIPLWTLEWQKHDGTIQRMDSTQGRCSSRGGLSMASLTWSGLMLEKENDVHVQVLLNSDQDGQTIWQMNVNTRSRSIALRQWTFPRILVPLDGAEVIQPNGWGIKYNDPVRTGLIQAAYPSLYSSMQFLAATRKGDCFYLGAHDSICNLKTFTAEADKERGVIRMEISALTEDASRRTGPFSIPFPIQTRVAPGDWYDAAQTYRQWVSRAPWTRKGPMARRAVTPDWLKQNGLWMMLNGVEGAVDRASIWANEMKVPTAAHWYRWHKIPFDSHYPDYFPALDGFAEAVKQVQSKEIRTMPYINARLWCPEAPSWMPENASACAVLQEDGSLRLEKYGDSPELAVMCPATEQWRGKINSLVTRIAGDFGVDGVYLDQVTAAAAVPCWNIDHHHPAGGGNYWAQGYRQMLIQAKQALGPDRILTSEENAECWMDILDAHLMVNTSRLAGEVIPLYPAVYNDYTLTFGFQYLNNTDFTGGLPFRAKMARAFVWGSQPGWVDASILTDGQYPKEAEYLKALGEARAANAGALMGRMLRPPVVEEAPLITVNAKDGDSAYTLDLPAVLAGLFVESAVASASAQTFLVMTNWTDTAAEPLITPATGSIVPLKEGEWTPSGKGITGTMPPRSAKVVGVKLR